MVKAIPTGYHAVTPYLIVHDAKHAIDFYKDVFGAKELMRMDAPSGKIGHAELLIGDSHIMLADEDLSRGIKSAKTLGESPVGLLVYIENVDDVAKKAVSSGAKLTRPVEDQFYGDRMGTIIDPFGHTWHVATHVEDVSPDEMKKRMAALNK